MGMFSLIDTLLDTSMEMVLDGIPLAPDLKMALQGEDGPFSDILDFVLSFESGDWERFQYLQEKLGLDDDSIATMQIEAIKTAGEVINIGA